VCRLYANTSFCVRDLTCGDFDICRVLEPNPVNTNRWLHNQTNNYYTIFKGQNLVQALPWIAVRKLVQTQFLNMQLKIFENPVWIPAVMLSLKQTLFYLYTSSTLLQHLPLVFVHVMLISNEIWSRMEHLAIRRGWRHQMLAVSASWTLKLTLYTEVMASSRLASS
jgi:hypothetical protein